MTDLTKKVTTRDGKEVRIFTTEGRNEDHPVVGEVFIDGEWSYECWTIEGKYSGNTNSKYHLINPPEEKWINVYPGKAHATREEADEYAVKDRIACIKFKEGEGL